jgi:DNA-binding MarR family transcriptional regulator
VLLRLGTAPDGAMRMSVLADSVLLSRSGLTRLVDRLERAGLVERRECEDDARGLLAIITEEGRELWTKARGTHLAGVRRLFLDRFSQEEQRTLGGLFERLS